LGDIQYEPHESDCPTQPLQQSGEPWVAAQSLTFLKRGSPASEQKKVLQNAADPYFTEVASMPSLASMSDGTSPSDGGLPKNPSEDDNEKSDLFMAAIAMTEFGNSPPPKRNYRHMTMSAQKLDDQENYQHDDHNGAYEKSDVLSDSNRLSDFCDAISNYKRQKSDISDVGAG
jgi:hypothetical protein